MPEFGSKPIITINGRELPADLDPLVLAVQVESDLNAPGSCVLVLADPNASVLGDLNPEFGDTLKVSASPVEESQEITIFEGTIYGLEFEADEQGFRTHIRGYDGSFPLRQHRDVATFLNVSDDDVINKVASAAGVKIGSIETGSVVREYVAQHNETAWDFIRRRARLNNCLVYMKDNKLCVTPTPKASDAPSPGGHDTTDPLQLVPGSTLQYLRVGASSVQQVGNIEARGWDPKTQKAVIEKAKPDDGGVAVKDKPAKIGTDVGAPDRLVVVPHMTEPKELRALAESIGSMVASSLPYLEGRGAGDPRLQAGVAVSVGETGRFDGKYTITTARHVFGPEGYHTDITVSGEHDRTIYGLSAPATAGLSGLSGGTDIGVVSDIKDPDAMGRVKVTLEWMGDNHVSDWARVSQIGAGEERGIFWLPEVGDEVIVGYLRGDRDHPIVLGSLYNGKAKPIEDALNDGEDGLIDERILCSRKGHLLQFSDKDGAEKIVIRTAKQNVELELNDADKKLTITCKGEIAIKTEGGAVNLESSGDVSVKTDGNLEIEAAANATIKAGANLNLEAGANVEVSGAQVKIGQMVALG